MNFPRRLVTTILFLSLGTAAGAEEPDSGMDEAAATPAATTEALEDSLLDLDAFEDSTALSDEELGGQRARESLEIHQVTINAQDQDGDVTDNVALGNTNGDNLIDGNAFSHSSGFLSTVQNTGNNVLIQTSTIINVSVDTPPAE